MKKEKKRGITRAEILVCVFIICMMGSVLFMALSEDNGWIEAPKAQINVSRFEAAKNNKHSDNYVYWTSLKSKLYKIEIDTFFETISVCVPPDNKAIYCSDFKFCFDATNSKMHLEFKGHSHSGHIVAVMHLHPQMEMTEFNK